MAKSKATNVRDAGSGKFVSKTEAKKRPKTTVTEARKPATPKRKYETVPCPVCGESKYPGINHDNYNENCGNCNGKGKIRKAVK